MRRRQSWPASGLDVRGRVHRLEKSYRTTLEILNFTTLLYRRRLPEDDEKIIAPNLQNMPHGALRVVIPLTSPQDEATRFLNEIRQLVDAGVHLGDILIIQADWRQTDRLLARLRQEFGAAAATDPRHGEGSDYIRVCLLDAATGLESPIVFLLGVHALYEEEQSAPNSFVTTHASYTWPSLESAIDSY